MTDCRENFTKELTSKLVKTFNEDDVKNIISIMIIELDIG